MASDWTTLRRELGRQDWTVTRNRAGHWSACPPGSKRRYTLPHSPSDRRSWANTLAGLRRAGFTWPHG